MSKYGKLNEKYYKYALREAGINRESDAYEVYSGSQAEGSRTPLFTVIVIVLLLILAVQITGNGEVLVNGVRDVVGMITKG